MIKGDIFERDVRDDHAWRTERRLILDVTDTCVLYQIIYDPPEGLYVEHDETADKKQATMKEWRTWAKLASKQG